MVKRARVSHLVSEIEVIIPGWLRTHIVVTILHSETFAITDRVLKQLQLIVLLL